MLPKLEPFLKNRRVKPCNLTAVAKNATGAMRGAKCCGSVWKAPMPSQSAALGRAAGTRSIQSLRSVSSLWFLISSEQLRRLSDRRARA